MSADWPPRFKMVDMTPAEAAKFLRDLCELTARQSRDWDNMQTMFAQFLTDAYKGGNRAGIEAAAKEADAHIARNELGKTPCYYEQGHECAESIAGSIRALLVKPGETKT
jgi:hypothetical protein